MIDSIEQDAHEYGLHVKQGGWRLGLLVARNVEKGKGQSERGSRHRDRDDEKKVSASSFGRAAGTTADRVLRYLDAWEKAAEAGHVPAAATLSPGDEVQLDAEKLPYWGSFYTSISGGYNGGAERKPTALQAKTVLEQLSVEEAAVVITEALDSEAVIEAVRKNDDAIEHIFNVTSTLAGNRGKSAAPRSTAPLRTLEEMTVVLDLIGVLGTIRNLAKTNSDSPLIKECKNLMRETLEILDAVEQADDPEVVEQMLNDFGNFLSAY